jgi:O-antigen/teichoic acid export membrane protein
MGSKDQYWLKSGIINILQNFSTTIINIGTFAILTRLYGDSKHEFGAWNNYMQAIIILEIIRNGLIQSALIKFMSGAEQKKHSEIVSASFVISGTLTLFCIIINYVKMV